MSLLDTALSRRSAIQSMAGLVIGVYLPNGLLNDAADAPQPFAPNAFVRIGTDDTVTVLIKHIELGQGTLTGLTTLIAEELDADWSQVRAEHAPSDPELYKNLFFGVQGTGGSTSVANSYEPMRQAGATARAMLVTAAANAWRVPVSQITIERGVIRHAGSGREARFGQFVEAAARLPVPAKAPLKNASAFRLIGHDHKSVRKVDSTGKSTGKAQFTIDIREPGMLTVLVAHPPCFGARVASVDDADARRVPGVVDIRPTPYGIAVYADGYWPAHQARERLRITWDESAAEKRGSEQLVQEYRALAQKPGRVAAAHGDIQSALTSADKVIEAEFIFPYLAHAPMEPLNGFLSWDGQRARARLGSQLQTADHQAIAKVLGLPFERVELETMLAGGSFGRRAQQTSHLADELAHVAKAIGPGRPVKLVWTREDDIRGGHYRPLTVHRLRGALRDGKIVGWANTVVTQSIIKGSPFEEMVVQNGIDATSIEGARELPYDVANFSIDLHTTESAVSVLWWRSVGHTHTGFAVETFIDELLEATGQDPVAGRLALMGKAPREAGALRAVAELARWSGPQAANGRARGVAVVKSFNTYVAQIAEVSLGDGGEPRVHKVWCAVDCGVALNPDVIRAQMEGGIGFGLGAVLYSEIPIEAGRAVPSNFDGYRVLRINEMPEVEVVVIRSSEKPTGVGEPGVPPIGPAVANAIARLGVPRPRRLPLVGRSA